MIDMHIHTKYSDGTYTVKEVLEKAENLGLEYISITDHDNCRAYNELENLNVKEYFSGKLVRGIELKCLYNARLIEILGYNYDKEILERWLNDFYKNRQRKDTQTEVNPKKFIRKKGTIREDFIFSYFLIFLYYKILTNLQLKLYIHLNL